jgi:fido (protein-threonine AMPylation protein)
LATPSDKLAQSLEVLHELQVRDLVAIRSGDLSRTHLERLCREGFLQKVFKGWYIPSSPQDNAGDSTPWYTAFWPFCAAYLEHRFGGEWCLSPEQSIALHAENRTVPTQLLVRSPKGQNNNTSLPHGTSLFEVKLAIPDKAERTVKEGLQLMALPAALIACAEDCYRRYPTDMRTALSMIRDASELLGPLLDGGHSAKAGRIASAMRNIGRKKIADEIIKTMRKAGYDIRENDPFESQSPMIFSSREISPYVNRLRLMWQEMRAPVLEQFPAARGLPKDKKAYLKQVEDIYVTDAYHSLSIEGYRVTRELVERVRSGDWNPDQDQEDRNQRDALAARGYHDAFQAVTKSLKKILQGKNPGQIADDDHATWYRELFGPSVTAGLLRPADLAGYRSDPVYIRRSMHVPPSREAVRDLMPTFFELLSEEQEPAVRVVLGHFLFVYIHPYMDGNGRMGRFLMNAMLASGGYPWTVILVEQRAAYMAALEEASVRQNIEPFRDFLVALINHPITDTTTDR